MTLAGGEAPPVGPPAGNLKGFIREGDIYNGPAIPTALPRKKPTGREPPKIMSRTKNRTAAILAKMEKRLRIQKFRVLRFEF
jgi:hypothetical protein